LDFQGLFLSNIPDAYPVACWGDDGECLCSWKEGNVREGGGP
jgi:hypothetical protein